MRKSIYVLFILLYCLHGGAVTEQQEEIAKASADAEFAQGAVDEKVSVFLSANDVQEECAALAKLPNGDYSKSDREDENLLCAINFYDDSYALCPKTWSTSPGTMVYDLGKSSFDQQSYETSSHCGQKAKGARVKTAAKLKTSMNASGTSGTFSQSALLYYHFSRYFDTKVKVPVAVYREMDRDIHLERVSSKGRRLTSSGMIAAGWDLMVRAETNPSSYRPTDDIFTNDRTKIYGTMYDDKGERYATEFNGTRASGWGKGQNRDFQKTPGFLALRSPLPLAEAIPGAVRQAAKDRKMRRDLVGLDGMQGQVQVAFWMRELIEITLLDYIFSQQDRVGNIDYTWHWVYLNDGATKSKREKRDEYESLSRREMQRISVPEKLRDNNALLIQRTHINDNDAGGRVAYANFSKSTGMLNNLKHYSAKIYHRLMSLDSDLQAQGPIFQWVNNNLGLSDSEVRQIVSNTAKAAAIIRRQCADMQFDLDDVDNLYSEGVRIQSVDCD